MKNLVVDYEEQGKVIPKDQRFAHRFAKMLQDGFGKTLPKPRGRKKRGKEKIMDEDEAIAQALMEATTGMDDITLKSKKLKYDGDNDPSVTPFMKACDLGQVTNVQTLMDMDPDVLEETDGRGRTALQRLLAMEEEDKDANGNHDKIIEILKQ